MKITEVKVSEIKPYELNAKLHNRTQIENVAESIKQFGWQQPIVVDKDYIIIIGHCRFEAAKILGLDKVPVQVADDLNEEQVKKLRIIDNKTNESEWDYELLKTDIEDLDFSDFELDLNFDDEEVNRETELADLGESGNSKEKEIECPYCGEKIYL